MQIKSDVVLVFGRRRCCSVQLVEVGITPRRSGSEIELFVLVNVDASALLVYTLELFMAFIRPVLDGASRRKLASAIFRNHMEILCCRVINRFEFGVINRFTVFDY